MPKSSTAVLYLMWQLKDKLFEDWESKEHQIKKERIGPEQQNMMSHATKETKGIFKWAPKARTAIPKTYYWSWLLAAQHTIFQHCVSF